MEMIQLAVFVRTPRLGEVKTRLGAVLGAQRALGLYRAFVEDTLELCVSLQRSRTLDVALWTAGPTDAVVDAWSERLGAEARRQPEGDLGERIAAALREGLVDHEAVVLLGSDAPTLPAALVATLLDELARVDMALGPTSDGGYYAIGAARGFAPDLTGVRWSTRHALIDTMAVNAGARIALASPWYDVDGSADLVLLKTHLALDPLAAPATASYLKRFVEPVSGG